METTIKTFKQTIILIILGLLSVSASGQQNRVISGTIMNNLTGKAIPYATVVLLAEEDSSQLQGTISEMDGNFETEPVKKGSYLLQVSHVGYKPATHKISVTNTENYHTGTIFLMEKTMEMEELVILGKRIRAKKNGDKTTYFIDKKIQKATSSGVEILQLMPGVQVDLMQNLSVAGSGKVDIYVEGKKRSLSYLRQLNPKKINKISINTAPGAQYEAGTEAIIQVELKEKETGFRGHINAELPTSTNEIYMFPSYNFSYGLGKFNFYTSYDGEVSQFNITEYDNRMLQDGTSPGEISTIQHVRQNNWSHRFNLGIDYYANKKNQFNFYSYNRRFSQEHDGNMILKTSGDAIGNSYWSAQKDDTDRNYIAFYSLYYKHLFNKDRKFSLDMSYYRRKANNSTTYAVDSVNRIPGNDIVSTIQPSLNTALVKIDYNDRITNNWKLKTGMKGTRKISGDETSGEFNHNETILGVYAMSSYSVSPFHLSGGLRYEKSFSELTGSFSHETSSLLPYGKINYSISEKQDLSIAYRSSLSRPNVYELNPLHRQQDPYRMRTGNPGLKKELRKEVYLDYSIRPGNNFVSARMFYQENIHAIHLMTVLNENNVIERVAHNMGDTREYGVQCSGSLRFGKAIFVNPFLKVFSNLTLPNEFAREHGVDQKESIEAAVGLSAMVAFSKTLMTSMQFQYATPSNYIQSATYSDALYMATLTKSFKNNMKVGFTAAIPFNKSFTYHGRDIAGKNFASHSKGIIKTSGLLGILKLSYNFNTGKKIQKIKRSKEKIEEVSRKGF